MIIIGGKEYNLQFTMPVWDRLESEICLVEEFDDVMMQKGRLKKAAKLVSIMSVEQPVKAEDIWNDMVPADVRNIIGEAREVIREGLKMKVQKDEDNKVVDVVLEEIEKKETGAD